MGKVGAFITAAGTGAFFGAFAISIGVLMVYLGNEDGSPPSAKVAAALSVHLLATAFMFIIACVVGSTIYLLLRRFGIANYFIVGGLGLAVGLVSTPRVSWALGGVIAAVIFHWRYSSLVDAIPKLDEPDEP